MLPADLRPEGCECLPQLRPVPAQLGHLRGILLTRGRAHRDAGLRHREELVDDLGEAVNLISGALERPNYHANFVQAWDTRTLPPRIEEMVWQYAWGKPRQAIDLNSQFDPLEYLASKSK